eukprot:CAMPEP_0204344516 /NCGR_PEP_ID=MMETSP0469-20131031/25686_1 /ASSEMBLY_ACC=CAM_ASM_000384 /TAXON_ID=2969 /ORGANISM="Oxyrrhis marina" /LENGTH=33 /DNA_ID= /DNA_START= /DNA_END= /DNA_ORIENTATION=
MAMAMARELRAANSDPQHTAQQHHTEQQSIHTH